MSSWRVRSADDNFGLQIGTRGTAETTQKHWDNTKTLFSTLNGLTYVFHFLVTPITHAASYRVYFNERSVLVRWLAACQTTSGDFLSDYIYIDNLSTGVYPSGSPRWIMLNIINDRYVSISRNTLFLTIWRFIPRQAFRMTRHAMVVWVWNSCAGHGSRLFYVPCRHARALPCLALIDWRIKWWAEFPR